MAEALGASSVYRFGVFEFDPATGELRKQGMRLKPQGQPIEILKLLLEHPGEVVPREELQKKLWPADTFVDFEHSLNAAVKRLRDALDDSAETPRYIETLSRRGYRFIVPVEARTQVKSSVWTSPEAAPPLLPLSRLRVTLIVSVVIVLSLSIGAALAFRRARLASRTAEIRSIVVLPLENLSNDTGQDYLVDGMTDALTTELGQLAALRVISQTSAMHFKGTREMLPDIARELNVDAVVEGSVARSGNRLHVSIRLMHAPTDRQLWTESYERDVLDVTRLPEQLALSIAHQVSGRLSLAEGSRSANLRATSVRAYDAYLRGRFAWNERNAETHAQALRYFKQALQDDPDFALAYSGLSDCYSINWEGERNAALAEEYARKALSLQPDLPQAHVSLALACGSQGSQCTFASKEKELGLAIQLNPNYAMAHHWYAGYLLSLGRLNDALAENDRARELDPFSFPVNIMRGVILTNLRQYDRAEEQLQKAAAINPESAPPHELLARVYWTLRRVPEALAEERKAAILGHHQEWLRDQEEIATTYEKSGVRAALLKSVRLRERDYKVDYGKIFIALQYGNLKSKEKVLDWLGRMSREGDGNFILLAKSAPEFDFVRSDQRFRDLLRSMNFPQ